MFGCNSSCSNINSQSGCRHNGCSCHANDGSGCASSGVAGTSFPDFMFPPRPSASCSVCPPGTRPCPCNSFPPHYPPYTPYPPYCPGQQPSVPGERAGTFAFLNTTSTSVGTGTIVPLRYVLGTGNLGKSASGGTVNLDSGTYIMAYSLGATASATGGTTTITPEYGGTVHSEYARTFTTTDAGQSFEISDILAFTLPTDTTFSLNVALTSTVETETPTLTGVNASAVIYKVCDIL